MDKPLKKEKYKPRGLFSEFYGIRPKLKPFRFHIKTDYSFDANYPTDNQSETNDPLWCENGHYLEENILTRLSLGALD